MPPPPRLILAAVLAPLLSASATAGSAPATPLPVVERWGVFELALAGPSDGNPFTDVELFAHFSLGKTRVQVRGFYDGQGTYRVRFMPEQPGTWRYVTSSNRPELDGKRGGFQTGKPATGNHGPVRVDQTYHFARADGTAYYPIGTTVYALPHQPEALQRQTLATLATGPFNKLRFCVLPKWYTFNRTEPLHAPFERRPDGRFDVFRPNPVFYQLLERRIAELRELGIEADLILFHPYDEGHWGFDRMGRDADQQYLRYVIARLGALRNVWWSMANEWDLDKRKTVHDWNQLFDIVAQEDPYGKLCSIHQASTHFDHDRRPITHVSVQNADGGIVGALRVKHRKPAIDDECEYEGNIEEPWGNIDGRELIHRIWQGTIRGGYVGHGETFLNREEILWWSKGGVLRGESPPRIRFLRTLLEKHGRIEPLPAAPGWRPYPIAQQGGTFLVYLGRHAPATLGAKVTREIEQAIPKHAGTSWRFEVIDPWAMTITPVAGSFHGAEYQIPLPGQMFLAVRVIPAGTQHRTAAAVPPGR